MVFQFVRLEPLLAIILRQNYILKLESPDFFTPKAVREDQDREKHTARETQVSAFNTGPGCSKRG